MVRDISMAALFGGTAVMDAFVIANRIPNLFRELFGEGALTAGYLPVAGRLHGTRPPQRLATGQHDVGLAGRDSGWAGAGGRGRPGRALARSGATAPGLELLAGPQRPLLPYMLLICLAAQVTATLQTLGQFAVPGLHAHVAEPLLADGHLGRRRRTGPRTAHAQAYVVAASILMAGVLQLGVQLPALCRLGFRFEYNWSASRAALMRIVRTLTPMLFSLAITQINTFTDSLIAWGLAAAPGGPRLIPWLGGAICYPLRQGAAAAIYYGERLYQFPLADCRAGRGRFDLPPVEPARRPRTPRPPRDRFDAWDCGWCCV